MSPSFVNELESLGRTLTWWKARLLAVFGIAIVLAGVWAFALMDILVRYERFGRLTSWILLVAGAAALLAILVKTLRHRDTVQGVAATVEKAFPELDNHLINYIQFSAATDNNPFKTAYLKHAAPAWDQVDPRQMKDGTIHRKSWLALAVALVLLVLPGVFLGEAWPRALQRMVNPFSNLPPISLTHILDVQPGDTVVMQGKPVILSCRVQGMTGHEVSVEIDPDDAPLTRTSLGSISSAADENFSRRIPKVTTGFRYRFKAGDATPSEWYKVTTRPPAAFTDVQLTITPPEHMGLSAVTVSGREPGLRIAQGATVEVLTSCNTALRALSVSPDGGTPVSLAKGADAKTWKGRLQVVGGVGLVLRAEDETGEVLEERLPFTLGADLPPTIQIIEPRGRTVLPPGAEPRIAFKATDDFGLASVVLEKQVIATDGTRGWEPVDSWTPERTQVFPHVWKGTADSRTGGSVTYRVVAQDSCHPTFNVGASASVVFDVQTRAEAAKETKKLEEKAQQGLNQIVTWQRENVKATRVAARVADRVSREQWSVITDRQTQIRTFTRELLDNPLKPLGSLTVTVKNLYLNEMNQAVVILSSIPETSPDAREERVITSEQLQTSILRQLTAADLAMGNAKVDRRVSGISAVLGKLVKDQKEILKKTESANQDEQDISSDLVDAQDDLASDLSEFIQICQSEAAEVRANDVNFADVMLAIAVSCETGKVRNDMMMAAEQLDENQAKDAIPHEVNALGKLKALQAMLDGVKLQEEAEEQDEMQEALAQAKEKIVRVKDLHKKLLGFMEQVKEQEDVSDAQMEMMEEAYEELIKNSKEAMLEVPTDLHIFMDLNVANDLVEDVFSLYQELEQTAGSENWTEEDVFEKAFYKEEVMLEMMEEAEGRIDDMETWLVADPDMAKITAEAFDTEEMANEMALGALPTELQDLITDLKDQDDGADEAADDSATNHALPDLETGGPVLEGEIASYAAKGVSGGDRPDHKEQDGRSGVGRQGMSNGETAAGSGTINEGDNDIEARRTTDPTQGGQVDLDGEADTVATGGGKLASGKADELGMAGGVKRMDSNEEGSWEGMASLLAERTDSVFAKASMKNIRVESLQEAAHHIRQSGDAVAKGDVKQVRELRRLAVSALEQAQMDLSAGPTTAYEAKGSSSVLGDMVESSTDTAPPQYRDQVAEYYKVLNEEL